jgi:hypothetical protein
MRLMLRIDRISAWVLLFCIVLYILTGFDILRRLVNPQISSLLHLKYLFIPAQTAFAYHTSYAGRLALKRWNVANKAVIAILAIHVTANVALMIYYLTIQFS